MCIKETGYFWNRSWLEGQGNSIMISATKLYNKSEECLKTFPRIQGWDCDNVLKEECSIAYSGDEKVRRILAGTSPHCNLLDLSITVLEYQDAYHEVARTTNIASDIISYTTQVNDGGVTYSI